MVVFFTIYNAQSQRKRNFSCINQKKAPWKEEKIAREALNWCSCEICLCELSSIEVGEMERMEKGRLEAGDEI
jgi:hypothetical protein